MERGEGGKFVPSDNSLHPKTIGLRLPKRLFSDFEALAQAQGISMAELARKACLEYLENNRKSIDANG